MSKPTCAGLSLKQVEGVVTYWQNQFRLSDWSIVTKFVDPRVIAENSAEITYCNHRRKATLSIGWDCSDLEDLHDSVIHELLHLFFHFIPRESWQVTFEEQTIHAIAPVIASLFMGVREQTIPVIHK